MKSVGTVSYYSKPEIQGDRFRFMVSFYGASFVMSMMKQAIKSFEEEGSVCFSDIEKDCFVDIGVENISSFLNDLFEHCDMDEFIENLRPDLSDKLHKSFNSFYDESLFQEAILHFYHSFANNPLSGDFFEFYVYPLSKLGSDNLKKFREELDEWIVIRQDEEARRLNIQQKKEAYEATKKKDLKND